MRQERSLSITLNSFLYIFLVCYVSFQTHLDTNVSICISVSLQSIIICAFLLNIYFHCEGVCVCVCVREREREREINGIRECIFSNFCFSFRLYHGGGAMSLHVDVLYFKKTTAYNSMIWIWQSLIKHLPTMGSLQYFVLLQFYNKCFYMYILYKWT